MGWLATVRLEVLKLAVVVPPLLLKVPWPMLVPPSEKITRPLGVPGPLTVLMLTPLAALLHAIRNWTVPVAVPLPGAVTLIVTMKATFWPEVVGFVPDTTARLVLALLTVCVMAAELLTAKFVSPP